MRPGGGRRDGQVPPAWGPGDLRRDGADGAGFRGALSDGRRTGEFRQYRRRRRGGHALHRGAADALRARLARRDRRERGRFPRQLRRHRRRARGAARRRSQPPVQRGERHRRRHGDQHPAAQPGRGVRCGAPPDREPGGDERRAGGSGAGAGLPDRRGPRRVALGDRGGLCHRARQFAPARALVGRAAEPRPVPGGGHRNPLPDPEGAPDRADRRAAARAQAAFAGRYPRRIRGGSAPGSRAPRAHGRGRGR